MSIVLTNPASLGIRSTEERRADVITRIGKAQAKADGAEAELGVDSMRLVKADTDERKTAAANLIALDANSQISAENTARRLHGMLPAFDVDLTDEDIVWGYENRAKLSKIVRATAQGKNYTAGLLKSIQALRVATVK